MAKKTDSKSKPAAAAKGTAKPTAKTKAPAPAKAAIASEPITPAAPVVPVVATPAKATKAAKPAAAKAKAAKPKAAKAGQPKVAKAPTFTRDDIALRAYFIAEKRHQHGLPGDEHQDWVEAERQLLAESAKPKKTAKA